MVVCVNQPYRIIVRVEPAHSVILVEGITIKNLAHQHKNPENTVGEFKL